MKVPGKDIEHFREDSVNQIFVKDWFFVEKKRTGMKKSGKKRVS